MLTLLNNVTKKRMENESATREVVIQTETPQSTSVWKTTGIVVLVGILIACGIIALTLRSLPGESLYTLKTNVIEPLVEKMHIHSESKARYQVTRMQTRLQEIKKLRLQSTVSEKALTNITAEILKHSTTLDTVIAESIDSSFPKTDVLYTVNEFASVAGAIEAISEHDAKLQAVGDTAEDARQASEQLYKTRVKSFVQTETPQTVLDYIQTELGSVKDAFGSTDISKATIRSSSNYLDRVEPALTKSDLYTAIISIGEAYRILTIEKLGGITASTTQSGAIITPI